MFYPYQLRLEEGDILGLRSRNSMTITENYMQFAIFFTFTVLSLVPKFLRYSKKCKILTRQIGQLTCLTKSLGKHSRTHGQKNYALSSNAEGCPELFVKVLTSLMASTASKALDKFSTPFFLTKFLNFPPFFTRAKEVVHLLSCLPAALLLSAAFTIVDGRSTVLWKVTWSDIRIDESCVSCV